MQTRLPALSGAVCRALRVLALSAASAAAAFAQQSIVGTVTDAVTAHPIQQASIRVVGRAMHVDHSVLSRLDGEFSVLNLPPGQLQVSITKDGYLTEQLALSLEPRQHVNLDVLLRPAVADHETIQVTGSVELLDPSRAQTAVSLSRSQLDRLPAAHQRDIPRLVAQLVPGAIVGHDNFIHLKGNELSIHQFIDGVAFLDNANMHFTPGSAPQVIESVNVITGGMAAEFGNRLGGVLDIVTKSGRNFHGGSATLGGGTILARNAAFEYGMGRRKWDFYAFTSGFSDGRYLNPAQQREIHDLGYGSRSFLKLGYNPDDNDRLSLSVSASGANFELPNTTEELLAGRDALRRTREGSTILRWQRTLSPTALITTSLYNRYVSDRLAGTTDPVTPLGNAFRRTGTSGAKIDLLVNKGRHMIKTGVEAVVYSLNEDLHFDPRDSPDEHEDEVGQAAFASRAALPFRRPPAISFSPDAFLGTALPPVIRSEAGLPPLDFRGRRRGGQGSFYIQDQFSPFRNFTVHAGIRYDRYSVVVTEDLWSPRIGLSYHIPKTGTVVRAIYNRYFVPPPLEYIQLGSALGTGALLPGEQGKTGRTAAFLTAGPTVFRSNDDAHEEEEVFNPGPVRSLTQHYFEFGVQQRLHPKIVLDMAGFHHQGRNAFENAELSNTRLFVPVNFDRERTWGADFSLRMQPLDRLGLFGYLNYSHINTSFFGPVAGGLAIEEAQPGEKIVPAFDQRHTGAASIGYRHDPSGFLMGFSVGYGSGTPAELEQGGEEPRGFSAASLHTFNPILSGGGEDAERLVRLPEHWTFDFWTGVTVWKSERKSVELQFNLENIGNRIYAIGKESEATPVQYAGRRRFSGQLKFRF